VLSVECPGYHGVDRGEVSATGQAAVYTGTRQVTSIAHTHGEEMLSAQVGRPRGSLIGNWEESAMGKETARMDNVDLYSPTAIGINGLLSGQMSQEEKARSIQLAGRW